jgi:hypothetical protein
MGDCTAGEPRVLRYSCNNRQAVLSLGIACMLRKQALQEAAGRCASLAGVIVMPKFGDVDILSVALFPPAVAQGANPRERVRPYAHRNMLERLVAADMTHVYRPIAGLHPCRRQRKLNAASTSAARFG